MPRTSGLIAMLFIASACGQAASEEASSPSSLPAAAEEPAQGKREPCTLGADQTCNDDPSVSALWGRCTELGVCECHEGFELNPRGRCQKTP